MIRPDVVVFWVDAWGREFVDERLRGLPDVVVNLPEVALMGEGCGVLRVE